MQFSRALSPLRPLFDCSPELLSGSAGRTLWSTPPAYVRGSRSYAHSALEVGATIVLSYWPTIFGAVAKW